MPTLSANGYDMAFVERGTGAPLVPVHGTLGDYRNWAGQMAPFGARYRTIALSLRHCWPERWDDEGDDFTVERHAEDAPPSSRPRRLYRVPRRAARPDLVRKLGSSSRAARWTRALSRASRRKARRSRSGRCTMRPRRAPTPS